MCCIILVEHCICDIRHISSSITLTSDVDFVVAYAKDVLALKSQRESREKDHRELNLEILEEFNKLICRIFLIRRSWFTGRETYAHGILNPKHIGEIHPRIWVDLRRILTPCPLNKPIFLEETFE